MRSLICSLPPLLVLAAIGCGHHGTPDMGGADGGGTGTAVCGNGVIEAGEQCDDGNRHDLDGCDANCRYEVVARFSTLAFQGTPAPPSCTPATNAFGTQAFTGPVLSQLNMEVQAAIDAGRSNLLLYFLGLTDDSGSSGSGFRIGLLDAALDPARGAWPGNDPIDWSFLAGAESVAMGQPTGVLGGGDLSGHALSAGPGTISVQVSVAGVAAQLQLNGARLIGAVGASESIPMPPPAHLAQGLQVFEQITADQAGQGLCGNITVGSLAQVPVPQALTTGATACSASCGKNSRSYTYCGDNQPVGAGCNSLLDVLVGGCAIQFGMLGCIPASAPTQPDVPGTGTVKPLSPGAKNKVALPLEDNDAYSAYLSFTAQRAHISGQACTMSSQCQTGQACSGGTCR